MVLRKGRQGMMWNSEDKHSGHRQDAGMAFPEFLRERVRIFLLSTARP